MYTHNFTPDFTPKNICSLVCYPAEIITQLTMGKHNPTMTLPTKRSYRITLNHRDSVVQITKFNYNRLER